MKTKFNELYDLIEEYIPEHPLKTMIKQTATDILLVVYQDEDVDVLNVLNDAAMSYGVNIFELK